MSRCLLNYLQQNRVSTHDIQILYACADFENRSRVAHRSTDFPPLQVLLYKIAVVYLGQQCRIPKPQVFDRMRPMKHPF